MIECLAGHKHNNQQKRSDDVILWDGLFMTALTLVCMFQIRVASFSKNFRLIGQHPDCHRWYYKWYYNNGHQGVVTYRNLFVKIKTKLLQISF